ncbi:MAG TPA: guanylate kinase, partial [Verrucomicrobiae bacterium]|nr:guanylate kinase [Verrucomicrobiae bacterium]
EGRAGEVPRASPKRGMMIAHTAELKTASQKPAVPMLSPLLILISAPSGGGKTTLCHQLLAARPGMSRVITCTTRPPRDGEQDGVDYYFMDAASFLKRVQAGHFLEHATVYGHSYGTLKSEVLGKLRHGKDVLLNVDVQGAAAIRQKAADEPELKNALVSVFLTPASLQILEERLRRRATDSEAVIQKRLGVARQEIAQWKNFDYLLVSGSIREDLERMLAIVEAEKMRTARSQGPEGLL